MLLYILTVITSTNGILLNARVGFALLPMLTHFSPNPALLCPELGNPENGQVVVEGRKVGSTASYTCNEGYRLHGLQTRTCQFILEWSGSEPRCNRKSILEILSANVNLEKLALATQQ